MATLLVLTSISPEEEFIDKPLGVEEKAPPAAPVMEGVGSIPEVQ